jgi:hypothetical protein
MRYCCWNIANPLLTIQMVFSFSPLHKNIISNVSCFNIPIYHWNGGSATIRKRICRRMKWPINILFTVTRFHNVTLWGKWIYQRRDEIGSWNKNIRWQNNATATVLLKDMRAVNGSSQTTLMWVERFTFLPKDSFVGRIRRDESRKYLKHVDCCR